MKLKEGVRMMTDLFLRVHCHDNWANCQRVATVLHEVVDECVGAASNVAWPVVWDENTHTEEDYPTPHHSPPRSSTVNNGWCNR